eukprot:m.195054 g.195054  ORF g.195054 m.195054 type:complete len:466 (-) comp15687_c0_seq6:38-1435(-)
MINFINRNRTGKVPFPWLKAFLISLSVAYYEEKLRGFFLVFDLNGKGHISGLEMRSFLACMAYLIEAVDEAYAFVPNASVIDDSIAQCAELARIRNNNDDKITEEIMVEWGMKEPMCVKWLPTLHRLVATENSKHDVACHNCNMFPIIGFRYKKKSGLKPLSFCQSCFWSGHGPSPSDVREYCFQTTSGRDSKDFFSRLGRKIFGSRPKKVELAPLEYEPIPSPPVLGQQLQQIQQMHREQEDQYRPRIHRLGQQRNQDLELQTLEQLSQRARELGASDVSPMFQVGEGIHSSQKQELLRVIDELQHRNNTLQAELARAGSTSQGASNRANETIEKLVKKNRMLRSQLEQIQGNIEFNNLPGQVDSNQQAAARKELQRLSNHMKTTMNKRKEEGVAVSRDQHSLIEPLAAAEGTSEVLNRFADDISNSGVKRHEYTPSAVQEEQDLSALYHQNTRQNLNFVRNEF